MTQWPIQGQAAQQGFFFTGGFCFWVSHPVVNTVYILFAKQYDNKCVVYDKRTFF